MTALDELEKRLEGPGLIVALAKDEARDLLSAARAPDHIGNSTTMVPTLDVEGVARMIFDATYDARHGSTSEMEAFWSRCDSAARAIIAMEKNDGATLGVAQIKATIWKHWRNQNGQTLEDRFTSAAEEIAAMEKNDGEARE